MINSVVWHYTESTYTINSFSMYQQQTSKEIITKPSKKIKYVGENLTKGVKDVYNENFKPLKVKNDPRKCKNSPCSWIRGISIFKITILLKAIYKVNAIPLKFSIFFTKTEKS